MAAASTPRVSCNLGFLSILHEPSGFVGGYLVTNAWGRPLEFRLSSAVQPNRVQQILYGASLEGYIAGEVIGKTLYDKTAAAVQALVVDSPITLSLRRHVEVPIGLWHDIALPDQPMPGIMVQPRLYCSDDFPDDAAILRAQIDQLGPFDFGEPFARIREAMNEARKLGVASRNLAA